MHNLTSTANTAATAERTMADGRTGALLALIGRMTDAIEAETAAIRTDPKYDIKASNARKSRHLHELGKAFKGIVAEDLGADHREAMLRLRGKLAANEATIQAHLGAVGEVAALLQKAIEQAQADGTYTVREFGR